MDRAERGVATVELIALCIGAVGCVMGAAAIARTKVATALDGKESGRAAALASRKGSQGVMARAEVGAEPEVSDPQDLQEILRRMAEAQKEQDILKRHFDSLPTDMDDLTYDQVLRPDGVLDPSFMIEVRHHILAKQKDDVASFLEPSDVHVISDPNASPEAEGRIRQWIGRLHPSTQQVLRAKEVWILADPVSTSESFYYRGARVLVIGVDELSDAEAEVEHSVMHELGHAVDDLLVDEAYGRRAGSEHGIYFSEEDLEFQATLAKQRISFPPPTHNWPPPDYEYILYSRSEGFAETFGQKHMQGKNWMEDSIRRRRIGLYPRLAENMDLDEIAEKLIDTLDFGSKNIGEWREDLYGDE